MWTWISGGILLPMAIVFGMTKNYQQAFVSQLERKEHKLYLLYSLSLFIIFHTPLEKYIQGQKEERDMVSTLNRKEDAYTCQILWWCQKLATILLIIYACLGLCLVSSLQKNTLGFLKNQVELTKQEAGTGTQEVTLQVETDTFSKEEITVKVPEKVYKQEEITAQIEKAKKYVSQVYLGENKSPQKVVTDLRLVKNIPNSAILVEWNIDNLQLINENGKIKNLDLEAPISVGLQATFSYGEVMESVSYPVEIQPREAGSQAEWKEAIEDTLEAVSQEHSEKEILELPKKIAGKTVIYKEYTSNHCSMYIGLGIVTAIFLWFGFQSDLKKKLKTHDQEMLLDYPELVNKFTLLLNAGMTVQGAWTCIARQYMKKRKQGGKKRYAYEEWCWAWNEMQNGVTEGEAIVHFGQRTRLMPYLKFTTLLNQNLRKGSKDLVNLLEYEARDAFETRKQMTLRLAEEAGTKLLAPMMVMLVLVMIIIMVPAMLSFQG